MTGFTSKGCELTIVTRLSSVANIRYRHAEEKCRLFQCSQTADGYYGQVLRLVKTGSDGNHYDELKTQLRVDTVMPEQATRMSLNTG